LKKGSGLAGREGEFRQEHSWGQKLGLLGLKGAKSNTHAGERHKYKKSLGVWGKKTSRSVKIINYTQIGNGEKTKNLRE